MSKLMYKKDFEHIHVRNGIYYFVRRVPSDLLEHYQAPRISLSLKTKSASTAHRAARSISQRLEDYWLGLRLQKIDVPALHLLHVPEAHEGTDGCLLSQALDLYLTLKGKARDKTFRRTAERNTEYVIKLLGDKPVTAYSTTDAAMFRDWLIERGMGRSTVTRVFSSIRAIINLAITENGLSGRNGFLGTYLPDELVAGKRNPIPLEHIRSVQNLCQQMDDDLRWLIALISDTGMRLNEAAGLAKSDIHLDHPKPYIALQPHPWRRLKTPGSERAIPLVGASLWAAERLMSLDPGIDFAFTRYSDERGSNANSASAALNKWLRPHVPKGCVIHSFRHSMRDRLRAVECPSEIVDQIGGWSTAGVGQSYGSGYPIEILHKWMEKIA